MFSPICLSLSWLTAGTKPSMPGWSSLSASPCWIKHACHTLRLFATCKSQPPCLLRASRIPLFPLSLHSPPPLSQQMHFSPFALSAFCSCSSSSSVFPAPFPLFFIPSSPSLPLPSNRVCSPRWSLLNWALPPFVQEPWVVDCTERTPKALQATPPSPSSLYSRGRRRSEKCARLHYCLCCFPPH